MNIDKFLKFFVPKDHSFFPLFENDAQNLIVASEQLKLLLETDDPEKHSQIASKIKVLEEIGDTITNKTYEQLNKSFITPFDREDIHELATNIDDIMDSINGVARSIYLYKPKKLLPVYRNQADVIYQASKEIEICLNSLKDAGSNKKTIEKSCNKLAELEHKGDEIYYSGISELFEFEKNVTEFIKSKEVIELLEECIDQAHYVSNTLKAIIIKMS